MSKHYGKQRKRLGQNYLNDPSLIRDLIDLVGIAKGDLVVEPGAGEGSITTELLQRELFVNAIELDRGNCESLKVKFKNNDRLDLYCGDVLGFRPVDSKYILFGNPPFGITSKIVKHFLLDKNPPAKVGLLMQAEAAERIIGRYENSLLSVKLNYLYSFQDLFDVSPSAFTPRPSVEVVFLFGEYQQLAGKESSGFFDFVDMVYARSQGTIRGNLKKWLSNLQVKRLGDDLNFNYKGLITDLNTSQWFGIYTFYKSL